MLKISFQFVLTVHQRNIYYYKMTTHKSLNRSRERLMDICLFDFQKLFFSTYLFSYCKLTLLVKLNSLKIWSIYSMKMVESNVWVCVMMQNCHFPCWEGVDIELHMCFQIDLSFLWHQNVFKEIFMISWLRLWKPVDSDEFFLITKQRETKKCWVFQQDKDVWMMLTKFF